MECRCRCRMEQMQNRTKAGRMKQMEDSADTGQEGCRMGQIEDRANGG